MAANTEQIEQRLSSLESALTQVQQRLGLKTPAANWVDQISGSLSDMPEEEYRRFLECCREVRREADSAEDDEAS